MIVLHIVPSLAPKAKAQAANQIKLRRSHQTNEIAMTDKIKQ